MWQGALALIPSFVLTVLIGGAYASYLQQRSWRHQNQSRLNEEERKQAGEIRTALSGLLDKRLYRTLRLLRAIEDRAGKAGSDDELRDRRCEHEQALADWNDQLTTRLVSVEVCFGRDVHDRLKDIDLRFQKADGGVEELYRQQGAAPDTAASIGSVVEQLDDLREQAYQVGLDMMLHLRRGDVGSAVRHQQPSPSITSPTSEDPTAITQTVRRPGASIAISASGLLWIICMSMPVWNWSEGDVSGWEVLTGPGSWPGRPWAWLSTLAILAIAAAATGTLAENRSRYRVLVQRCAMAVGALSVLTLGVLGVQVTDAYHSACGSAAICLPGQHLGIGYYAGIAAALLTAAGGLWGTVQSQRKNAW